MIDIKYMITINYLNLIDIHYVQIFHSVRVKMTAEGKKCKLKKMHCRIFQTLFFVVGIISILFGISMVFLVPNLISTKIRQVSNADNTNAIFIYLEWTFQH